MLIYNQNRDSIFEVNSVGTRYDDTNIDGEAQVVATATNSAKGEIGKYPTRELAQMELNNIAESFNTGKTVYYMTKEEEKL